jgi:bacteriorhodopsin
MDVDLRTVLRWLIYGVIALLGLSLLGVLVDVASTLLWLLLKIGVVVLIVLFVLQILSDAFD